MSEPTVSGKTIIVDDDLVISAPFVDAGQLGLLLGVGRQTIKAWERDHDLPHYDLAEKTTRYNLAEIDVWLAARRKSGSPRVPLVDGVAPALRVRGLKQGQAVDVVINGVSFRVSRGAEGVPAQEIDVIVDGSVYRASATKDGER